MASHLHRYASELSSLEETLSEIAAHHKAIHDENTMLNDFQFQRIENGLRQVASQLRPIKHFETELEKKLQNILALVSRHQVRGVKVLKHSSFSIVSSSQMRTKHTSWRWKWRKTVCPWRLSQSWQCFSCREPHLLWVDCICSKLNNDVITNTRQALLAMPFFSQNRWLDDVPRFWVWVVLTVPSTGLAFAFYTYWKRRGQRSSKKTIDDEEGI